MRNFFSSKRSSDAAKTAENHEDAAMQVAHARIVAATTVEQLIDALRDTARSVVGSDGITIVRREGDEVTYVTEDAISPLWEGQRFPIRVCVSGMALQARTTMVIPDIQADYRVPLNAYLATFVRSMIVAPIGFVDPTLAIGAYWQVAGATTPTALDRLNSLAALAAKVLVSIEGAPEPGRQVA